MSLADALKPADRPPSHLCHTCQATEAMDDDDREALDAALANERVSLAQITRALQAEGHHVNGQGLARHAHGECRLGHVYRKKLPR